MFMRLLQLDDLMTSYTNTWPETGPIRAFTEVFAAAIEMPWTDGKPYIAGPRREPRRALDGMPTTRPESSVYCVLADGWFSPTTKPPGTLSFYAAINTRRGVVDMAVPACATIRQRVP
jgi:hypothetical protein